MSFFKLKQTALVLIAFFALSFSLGTTVLALTPAEESCNALKIQDSSVDCTKSTSISDSKPVANLVRSIINILSIAVGAVSVIMIIIGGFRYVISGGDASATKSAKDTIMYAVIGLVVVIFAQVIVVFVLTNTTAKAPAAKPTKKTTQISSSTVA